MTALRTSGEDLACGFDYDQIEPGLAKEIREVAVRVRAAHGQTIVAVLEIGRDLLAVKARLGHGHFGGWLQAEFGGVARTAQNYMLAAQTFAGKSEMVLHLPATTVYALAAPSTPKAVRSQIVERLQAGERMHPSDISQAVKAAKVQARRPKPAPTASAPVDDGHVLALSELLTILRLSLGEDVERVRELLLECRTGWTAADLASRL